VRDAAMEEASDAERETLNAGGWHSETETRYYELLAHRLISEHPLIKAHER
jgi:hypothetical protein